jgi:hypothetical protein
MGIPELESEIVYGDNFDEVGAFPSDYRPKKVGVRGAILPDIHNDDLFPANTSAQAFLPNKPNKSWRRPPGDFSIDTFYEDDFGQIPYRRY